MNLNLMKYVEDLQQVDFKEFGTHIQFNDVLTRSTHYAKVIDSDKKDMHERLSGKYIDLIK